MDTEMTQPKMSFEEYLDKHGTLAYTNVGVSMLPLLRQGRDVMVIRKKGPERCQKYDAVLFKRQNGQYVLHRIVKVLDQAYYIIGDNCISGEYVREDQVLGILTEVVRGKKTVRVTDRDYLFYVHLWCDFLPIRCFALRVRARIFRLGGKVLRALGLRKKKSS